MLKQEGKYYTIKYVIFYNFYFFDSIGYTDFKPHVLIHTKIDDFYSHVCFTHIGKCIVLKGRIHVKIKKFKL